MREIVAFQPDVIHSHHLWLVSSYLKDLVSDIPVVTQCHATGFRQMALCPELAEKVRSRCARNDRFCVLHRGHASQLSQELRVSGSRIHVVGAGYRDELFHERGRETDVELSLLYVGKLSAAKGLPWLLDAVEGLAETVDGLTLHVVGSGDGEESQALQQRMTSLAPLVEQHGALGQPELADLMRRSKVCVLPSFYEGVPLVLAEAAACGCRLVATALTGVVEQLQPHLDPVLDLVPLPRLVGIDSPHPEDIPAFVDCLGKTMAESLEAPAQERGDSHLQRALRPFAWSAVFGRVQYVWNEVVAPVYTGYLPETEEGGSVGSR